MSRVRISWDAAAAAAAAAVESMRIIGSSRSKCHSVHVLEFGRGCLLLGTATFPSAWYISRARRRYMPYSLFFERGISGCRESGRKRNKARGSLTFGVLVGMRPSFFYFRRANNVFFPLNFVWSREYYVWIIIVFSDEEFTVRSNGRFYRKIKFAVHCSPISRGKVENGMIFQSNCMIIQIHQSIH